MTKIVPITQGEQAEIRRLLRQADPARDISGEDLSRMQRMVLDSLDRQPVRAARWWKTFTWPTAALSAVAAGILFGNFIAAPLDMPASNNLVSVAAAEPWQTYADANQGDDQ